MPKNEVAKRETQEISNINERDFFKQYGDSVGRKQITGRLLKFSKGDWLAGQENEEIDEGTELTVNMDSLMVGWIKWVDGKPQQQIMGLLGEGYKPQKREDLDDRDPAGWEVGADGKPRDPWQFSNYVVMKPAGEQYNSTDAFTFAASSYGALAAIGKLSTEYAENNRQHPGEYPIVELGQRSYKHPNKQFGTIKNPTLEVTAWETVDLFEERAAPAKKAKKKRAA